MFTTILAQTNIVEVSIGTGAAGVLVGAVMKHFISSNKQYVNKELCEERSKNFVYWLKRIETKLDDVLEKRGE